MALAVLQHRALKVLVNNTAAQTPPRGGSEWRPVTRSLTDTRKNLIISRASWPALIAVFLRAVCSYQTVWPSVDSLWVAGPVRSGVV